VTLSTYRRYINNCMYVSIYPYWQRYCTALEQRPSAKLSGVVQGMQITELSQRAPPTFGGRPPSYHVWHRPTF